MSEKKNGDQNEAPIYRKAERTGDTPYWQRWKQLKANATCNLLSREKGLAETQAEKFGDHFEIRALQVELRYLFARRKKTAYGSTT